MKKTKVFTLDMFLVVILCIITAPPLILIGLPMLIVGIPVILIVGTLLKVLIITSVKLVRLVKIKNPSQADKSMQVAKAGNSSPSIPTTQFVTSPARVAEFTRVTPPRIDQHPPAALPFIPPAGWNPTTNIPFLNDGLPVSTETPLASRNEPLITPVISQVTSPNRADTVERASPFALEQQALNTQLKKTPPQRKPRKPSEVITQSIADPSPAPEGGRKPKTSYAVVRSAKLRKAAIQIHGRNCIACLKNFDEIYGVELAKGYIEVHHLNSIATGERTSDPATDLVPLCSNCHKMADRLSPPPRTISGLRSRLFPKSSLPSPKALSATEGTKSVPKVKIGKIREKKKINS